MSAMAQVKALPPLDFYKRRAIEARAESDQAYLLRSRYQTYFVALCVLVAIAAYQAFAAKNLPAWTLLLAIPPAVYFLAQSRRQQERTLKLLRLCEYYEAGIGRLTRNWDALDEGRDFVDPDHFYATDLDLFGRGSLFQLLCSARTQAGRETLANWMKGPAGREEVVARWDAIAELREAQKLREALAMAGAVKTSDCRPGNFRAWIEETSVKFPCWGGLVAPVFPLTLLALPLLYRLGQVDISTLSLGLVLTVFLEICFALVFFTRVRAVSDILGSISIELPMVSEIFAIVEAERFSSAKLLKIVEHVKQGDPHVRRLSWLIKLLKQRDDPYFTIFSYALLWSTQFTMGIELWRKRNGADLLDWLAALGEFEALNCLAAYAYEHPQDVFPELSERGPLFDAQGLAHPLLDETVAVRNDVQLGGGGIKFLIVSGSNMSGKSTFLRAVGLNAVLAWMGAPVRCAKLSVSSFVVGAAIRLQDSVVDGRSHFLTEMQRLRRLIDVANANSLLYLADEIMSGTNSKDRRVAAEWVIRALVLRGAIGLITTHDLALTEIASNGLPGQNVYFEDTGESGTLCFDYKLRYGLLTRSNALNIAYMLGIDAAAFSESAQKNDPSNSPIPPQESDKSR